MKTYILGLIGVVVVAGGGYFVWQNTQTPAAAPQEQTGDTTQTETGNTNQQTTSEESFSGEGSFASLMARGGSYQCTTSIVVQNSASEGTVFISGDKIRGDFTSRAAGMTITSHMITTGGYVYSWSDMVPQGVKSKVTASSQGGTAMQGSFDVNMNMQYDCEAWNPDQSKFVVPSTVTFMEVNGQ